MMAVAEKSQGRQPPFGCDMVGEVVNAFNAPWTVDPLSAEQVETTEVDFGFPASTGASWLTKKGEITATGDTTLTSEEPGNRDSLSLSGTLVSPALGEVSVGGTLTSMSPGTITVEQATSSPAFSGRN